MVVKAAYKQTEVGEIPNDWCLEPLGNHFTFKNGLNKAKEFFGFGTPIINYMDVYKNSGIKPSNILGLVCVSNTEIESFGVRKGDVFFTRTSETVEEVGISSVLLEETEKTVFSGFILRARPKNEKLNLYFKKYCFSSNLVRKQITSKSTYTTRALTNGRVLSDVLLPFPSLENEQEGIAGALSDADELIESLEKLIEKKRQIKQGAMQELLTGKTRLPGFSGEWQLKSISEICGDEKNIVDGPFGSNLVSKDYKKDGVPVLQGLNITNDKFVWKDIRYISSEKAKELYRSNATVGDLLTVKIGSVGFTAIINNLENNNFAIIPANLLRIRIDSKLSDATFLYWLLVSNEGKKKLKDLAGNTAQPAIGLTGFRRINFNIPNDVNEQSAIAEILTDMDSELAELEIKLTKARQIKQGMMQELLTGRIRLV